MKCKRESLNLNKLEESDYMLLFNKHAFLGVNPNDYKNLQLIGEQIAKKLGGCPLAIKVMGGMLNSCMDYEYWKKILEKDNVKLQQGNDDIMKVLRLSYDHLSTNLQLCFRYCSLFPQDHMFKRKKLVNMWIGSGLIPQSICGRERPEDIGKEYLNLLTRKSFFTCKTHDNRVEITKKYFMHDLLHDLARSVSLGECIRIGGDVAENIIPKTVRHLSVEMLNLLSIREISNLKNVHTLVISVKEDNRHNADHALEFIEVIKGFRKLRLLILDVNFHSYKLPNALSSLIHLRYLSLSLRKVVNESIEYDALTNLVNLRSLDVSDDVIENISYISKLPFIHILKNFIVQEKSGYKIGELKNLRELRHLCIRKLENVKSSEEAIEANLNEKKYLKSLGLRWSEGHSNSAEADEQLLDNLCPHINLKKMRIQQYQGAKSPCWMTNLSLVNLTSIELIDCKRWEHLPPLWQFSSLRHLFLQGLHAIKQIDCSFFGSNNGCAFPSLKKLLLWDMPNLEDWIGIDDRCMFPQLQSMSISDCPNLRGIPTLHYGLRDLHIYNQEHFQALESVPIRHCKKIEYIPPELFGKFKALKSLHIENCPKLTKRRISDIELPSVLGHHTICSFGDLEMPLLWSADLTSLIWLELLDCASIASLPPAQVCARWTMLSRLDIKNCKELSSIGGIQALVSLSTLVIEGCDKLIEVALLLQPPFPNDAGQKEDAADCLLKNGRLSIDHHALLLMEPLRSLSSLCSLTLSDASRLASLPEEWLLQNHAALERFCIRNARSLQSLPRSMTKLCSLVILGVEDANLIQSLPDLPTSLRCLFINSCHPVLKERCQENIGLDWPKIANIRYCNCSLKAISNLKNLRTLVIAIKENHEHHVDHILVFNEIVQGFKKLRLLSLDVHFDSYKLPSALNSLIHLRYLSLPLQAVMNKSFMNFCPQSPYRLYHLVVMKFSTIIFRTYRNIEYDRLTNLVNLRLLNVRDGIKINIRHVSKLPFIRKLKNFSVREESGYKISELKNLRDLCHLCIRGLENVRSSEEAMEAKLNEKEYLKSLSLGWSRGRSSCVEEDE
ncbi:Disease resistance protein RGA2 [Ananas comosus]|uniref:Disease resistance protein RGA2 n=1 Tax=Ananas comosus TaxID=4615 RepID=A0A199VFR1_ANACO|nr:Disease resistance protein RGA2 [Ananas comosus]